MTDELRLKLIELLRPFLGDVEQHDAFVLWANFDQRPASELLERVPLKVLEELAGDICPGEEDGST